VKEVLLSGLPVGADEAQVQTWFYEEGDAVSEGDEVCELIVNDAPFKLTAPCSGILIEVYFDEGETVESGEVICAIDEEAE
jgi:2-oxoisovalerate dehydrogenase E2 component (dihydrolipoyl transacylase)